MAKVSYKDWRTAIKSRLWPFPGEASSLEEAHNNMFLRGMIDLVFYVPCLQDNNTDVHPACSTYVECGKTLFDAPNGIVKRVYTIANDVFCNPVYYSSGTFRDIECWARNLLCSFVNPPNTGLRALQQGIKFADTESDSPYGRGRVGLWAIHRKRFYLIPWIQSNESVVIEWDGVKSDWADEDLLDDELWTPDVAACIQAYVKWQHLMDYEPGADIQDKRDAQQTYENQRAELIYRCEERTKAREDDGCGNRLPTQAELAAEAIPATTPTVFALIGNYGTDTASELSLADLVKSWSPGYIVSAGDNWAGSSTDFADLDAKVGKYFSDYLFPYNGSYGEGAVDEQNFLAGLGNHDRDPAGKLDREIQYFNLPTDKRYWDVVRGNVHFFFYDSGFDNSDVQQEADGIAAGSVQANWLQAKLTLSTAQWKVVICHHSPFSSGASAAGAPQSGDGTLSYPDLQLPFRVWGADVVISAHGQFYERLHAADGFNYIVNGSGGIAGTAEEPSTFAATPLSSSVLRYSATPGAIKATVTCDSLKLEFYATTGALVDSLTLI